MSIFTMGSPLSVADQNIEKKDTIQTHLFRGQRYENKMTYYPLTAFLFCNPVYFHIFGIVFPRPDCHESKTQNTPVFEAARHMHRDKVKT